MVNLGGVGALSRPWTESRREAILSSRVETTRDAGRGDRRSARGSAADADPGQRGRPLRHRGHPEPFTEDDLAAPDFLAQVTVDWEAATQPAVDAGARVVILRTSPVLDRSGGAFVPMKLAWSLGLGATLGDGAAADADDRLDD